MKHDVKVTVGICVRNAEATVGKAVESVLSQKFPRELMEIIVVDGCSEDGTLDIVKNRLGNCGIRCKIISEKEGLGRARQMVVDNARGMFIVWVDADMILSRDFLSKQVSFMEKSPKVGIAKGRYGILEDNNLVAILEDVEFALTFRYAREANPMSLGASGSIYRVEAVRQVGGFDKGIRGAGEDTDVENRVKANGWLLYVTSALFYEKRRNTWKSLWNEYFWHGIGASYVAGKNIRFVRLYKMLPPVAIIVEFLRVPYAYKLIRKRVVLLLPLHYVFKRIAWFFGFLKGRLML